MEQKYFNQLFKYMENANEFKKDLEDISKTWDQLILLSQLGSTGIDMSETRTNFTKLTEELISNLSDETIENVINEMDSKAQVTVDIVIRNLFERTADIGFLATDDDIRKFILNTNDINKQIEFRKNDQDDTQYRIAKRELKREKELIQVRFKEYVEKYSVYYDVVLFDPSGNIIAKLDETTSISKSKDEILDLCKNTKEDYVETYKYHDFLPNHKKSLVYSYKITKSNQDDTIIGFLALCFKFENEMSKIFSNLIKKGNKEVLMLLDPNGSVIATSDKYHIPLEVPFEIDFNKKFNIIQFAGRDYISKTCKTNGYEGFNGLGWLGHIMIPIDSAFNEIESKLDIDKDILYSMMQNRELFKKEFLDIPKRAQFIQGELDRAVWNGNIAQTKQNGKDNDFARSILREVRKTGEITKSTFNISIEKLNHTIISSLLNDVMFISSLAIDIMDRNLYERANDVRWWALTSSFKTILEKNIYTDEDKKEITNILKYINSLYTVYTNLFIYDNNGVIIAVSNPSDNHLIDMRLSATWIDQTLKLNESSKYSVSNFEKTYLYNNTPTYIYGASILGKTTNTIVGGIGIVFDSTPQFKDILNDSLPKIDGETKNGMFAIFVDKKSKIIISCSDNSHNIGEKLDLDSKLFNLENGESKSNIIEYKNQYYFMGVTLSSGYREYKSENDSYSNDILSCVFIKAGDIIDKYEENTKRYNNFYNYDIKLDDNTKEIATFYIGDRWLGVDANDVIESISMKQFEKAITTDTDHHFKGTASYKDYIVSVLDISSFIKDKLDENLQNEIIIIKYKDSVDQYHTIGILAERLGEIIKIPTSNIKELESHLIGGGMLAQSIVQPPKDTNTTNLLTILDISKISNLKNS